MAYFLLGLVIGAVSAFGLLGKILHDALKNKDVVRKIISEIYHSSVFPEIARIEGLLDLASREHHQGYVTLAIAEIKRLKERFIRIVKKYEDI
jgi:hypothetical protein